MIPFTVIGGYLGAGKTTLLNRILAQADGTRYALLVNDFGEVNIDGALIASESDTQINLTNGCVCCTLVDGFFDALEQLLSLSPLPDHIIVEASGVADVNNTAQYGRGPGVNLDSVIVIADAETVQKKAVDKFVGTTVKRQLAAADIVVLNKVDLVSQDDLQACRGWLNETFSDVPVVEAVNGDVPLNLLLGSHVERPPADEIHHEHEQYDTWRFQSNAALLEEGLSAFLSAIGDDVLRLKGFVNTENGTRLVQVVGQRREVIDVDQQAGNTLIAIGVKGQLDRAALDNLAVQFLG